MPRRVRRAADETGRDVPGRPEPRNAVSIVSRDDPVEGRAAVAGRANPVIGAPARVIGRIPWLNDERPVATPPPALDALVFGRANEVPGRATCAVAFSSIMISATPSSSISVSSIQFFAVSARVLRVVPNEAMSGRSSKASEAELKGARVAGIESEGRAERCAGRESP